MPGGGAPAVEKASGDSAGSGSALGLLQYIPESVKIVAGANVAVLSDKETPFGQQVLSQFRPLLTMLDRAGIKESQIDQLWSGADRDNGTFLVCVRTKSEYPHATVTKNLGAEDKSEKVGKASVHRINKSQMPENAVAYIDTKTLML
ncbi:MAG: hypothetical protein HY290_32360, partial [Planctomycetia bacterium]|nr:hypothetical protein [Planctomycetia bacterium]